MFEHNRTFIKQMDNEMITDDITDAAHMTLSYVCQALAQETIYDTLVMP